MRLRLGIGLAMSAVAVNGPLLVLALLHADGVSVPTTWRVVLLVVRALATVAVLSLGAAYIAHAAVSSPAPRTSLVVVWLVVLAGTAVIVTPMVVQAVGLALMPVIPSLAGRWIWALVSVVSVEVSGAGCMLAAGAAGRAAREEQPGAELARAGWQLPAQPSQLAESQGAEPVALPHRATFVGPIEDRRCDFCGRSFGSPYALGGHLRHCKRRRGMDEPAD